MSKLHLHCKRKCGWKETWGKMREHLKECGLEKKGKMEKRGREREWEREREKRERGRQGKKERKRERERERERERVLQSVHVRALPD